MFLRLPRMAYVFTTTKDGICSPGEGKEKERKTTYEMALLHREIHEKGGVGGRGLEDVDWRMVAQDRGQWRRVVHRAAETCGHPYP